MADQFRFDALACNGNEVIKTPNFDRLAALGVNFTNAFTPNPICVPGRASIITGCYSHKCIGRKVNSGTIKDDYVKMPEFFKKNSYKTYSIGKLHYSKAVCDCLCGQKS